MNAKDQVDALLAECGATLKRNSKHEIWLLPNGQKFTRGLTPSDKRAGANSLSDLKHALGIVQTEATVGSRRVRKPTPRKAELKTKYDAPVNSTLAEKLRLVGVTEQALRDTIEQQENQIWNLERARKILEQQRLNCRWCRLKKWWCKHRRNDADVESLTNGARVEVLQ